MRGRKVVWAGALALQILWAHAARAQFDRDLARDCRTITAFRDAPSTAALRGALARVGLHGRTRLDLSGPADDATAAPDDGIVPVGRPPRPTRWTLSPEAARVLADSPTSRQVTALTLDHDLLPARSARILASSTNFGAVESLSLSDTRVNAAVLHELLAPGAFPALSTLDLDANRLKPADVRELAARLAERKVRHVVLGRHADWEGLVQGDPRGNAVLSRSADGAAALAQVAATPSVSTLDLADEPLGFAELEAVFKVPRQDPLEIVTAAPFGRFSRQQMEALGALDPPGRITLSIEDLTPSPAVVRALDRSGLLAKTVALAAICGDDCARLLARSPNTARLRELELDCDGNVNVSFTAKTARALSTAVGLRALRKLAIGTDVEICQQSGIGIDGLRALLKAPFAGALESLRFEGQGLGAAGYLELGKAKNLGALKELAGSEWEPFLTREVARWLLRDGPLAPHLEVLRLVSEGNMSIASLMGPFKAPKLRVLEIGPTEGLTADWERFVRAPGLPGLEVLRTDMVPIDESEPGGPELAKALERHMPPGACVF